MPQLLKKLTFLTAICLIWLGLTSSALAEESFHTKLNAYYQVQLTGQTRVRHQFTITNQTPTRYVTQYGLEFGNSKLKQVKAYDKNGELEANLATSEQKTSIGLTFPDVVVGEGKQRQFTIEYLSDDIAIAQGKILEIAIPKFADASKYQSYQVIVEIPSQFGQPAILSPEPTRIEQLEQLTKLSYESPGNVSITGLFGEHQVYDLNLKYYLNNPGGTVGLAQIALPPDTPRQKVFFQDLDPLPEKITTDADGNWIATYQLLANSELEVNLNGKVKVYLQDQPTGPKSSSPDEYLKETSNWLTSDSKTVELAKNYPTAEKIYNLIIEKLSYNYHRDSNNYRKKTTDILEQPDQNACQEYTDLFIAVARAAGIPARRLTGYAHTGNNRLRPLSYEGDLLHAWPEYYDPAKKTWIPIDPTWGDTTGGVDYFHKLDFSHIIFAINGTSDTRPIPAGGYKTDPQQQTVSVNFSTSFPELKPQLLISVSRPPFWISGLKPKAAIKITNLQGVAWYQLPINSTTNTKQLDQSNTHQIAELLPYQTVSILVDVPSESWWQEQRLPLTISAGDISSNHELSIGLSSYLKDIIDFSRQNPLSLGIGGLGIAIFTGSILVFRQSKPSNIRRKSKKSKTSG